MSRWHIATTPVQIFSLLFRTAGVEGKVDDVDISKAYYLMPARPPGAPEDAHGVIFVGNWRVIDVAHGWGEIWTRPGLDRKTRSCITLTALVALGHLEELKLHVRAALRNGLTEDEIKEVLLQSAIYCGVTAANSAFAVAQRVSADLDGRPEAAGGEQG